MAVDASAVASVLGITTNFVDLREGVAALLPQQIYVIGQGSTASTYSLDKYRALSAGAVAQKYGFGCPLHNVVKIGLLPENGDGVGTIPVFILPLNDNPAGVAATGDLTISGTTSGAGEYRVRIGGIASQLFVIPQGAVDASLVHARAHDAITAVLNMPVITTYTYGATSSLADAGNTGDGSMGAVTVTGQPRPGTWTLTITAEAVDAGTFTLTDPAGRVSPTTGTVGVAYAAEGLSFTLSDGASDFAIGDTIAITIPATGLAFESRAAGAWSNDITLEAITPDPDLGAVFSFTNMNGGLANPVVDDALSKIGTDWATMIVNCLNSNDVTALDTIKTFGEGRYGTLVHQPLVSFVGNTDSTFAAATAVTSLRPDDRINSQLVAPGSPTLPFVVAARQVARIAKQANDDPAVDYVGKLVDGIIAGTTEQWDYPTRDAAVKAGSSTVTVRNGNVYIGDVVTMYNPTEEQPPGYRFVVDIVRTQNVIYNLWLEFVKPEWAGAPLIPDSEPTNNPNARKPKSAKAAVAAIIDGLADAAIVTNREQAKASIVAEIGGPRRLNVTLTTPYSTNTGIKDIQHNWGFIF